MPFQLKANEHLDRALQRIYGEELDDAIEKSRASSNGSLPRRVHDIRTDIKKMRAVLRLARPQIGARKFKSAYRRLRDAGRKLSPYRDATVRINTIDRLCALFFERRREFPKVRAMLARGSRERRSKAAAACRTIVSSLRTARRGLDGLELSRTDTCTSLHHIYKEARTAFRAARAKPERATLHKLRKRLKDLWYQLRIFGPLRPEVLDEEARQAKVLIDYIGENLDLAVIRDALTDRKWKEDSRAEREALRPIIDAHRTRLEQAALDLCRPFFGETPAQFKKRIGGYLVQWPS
jgi:CHAD domain-containing protein